MALAVLACVPGRRVYAAHEALHGRPWWQLLVASLLGDLLYVGPLLLLAMAVPLAFRRWRTAAALGAVVVVVAWMFSVGAIESRLERGLYPTYLETRVALGSRSFVMGQLPTLLLDRYRMASLVALAAAAALLALFVRRAPRSLRRGRAVAAFAATGAGLLVVAGGLVKQGRVLFPRTGGYLETRSPLETVAIGMLPFREHAALTDGMRELLGRQSYGDAEVAEGLAILGYPASSLALLRAYEGDGPCEGPHPLARPLDRSGADAAASAAEVLDALEAVSGALFDGRSPSAPPVIVWQIAMESFRGDDLHALDPLAPSELTPRTTALYEDPHAIAFTRAFQGGFRTAQNLSALTCGVGSLPFDIALARDLGHVPLRCLPDVLADGGFDTRAFYASDLAYDAMQEFFRYHGVATREEADLPADLPRGSWRGVSDRALYPVAVADAVARAATAPMRAQYNFVLTLSGHSPFVAPADLPPEVAARAARACAASPVARPDDCARLAVIAYADHALGELLDAIARSPVASRSLVVVSADHATSEIGLWPGSPEARGRAHVPYVMLVPDAVVTTAASPDLLRARLAAAHAQARTTPVSLADSPSLVTALLARSPELRGIPAPWRFHTYGGQSTSASFAFAARPGARLWGTDSAAFVFSADATGDVSTYATKNRMFDTPSDLDDLNPSLRGPAALLSSFVKGYLRRCESHPLRR